MAVPLRYREIPNDTYTITKSGVVKNIKSGKKAKIMEQFHEPRIFLYYRNAEDKTIRRQPTVALLLAMHFLGATINDMICYADRDPRNWKLENLQVVKKKNKAGAPPKKRRRIIYSAEVVDEFGTEDIILKITATSVKKLTAKVSEHLRHFV